ncbi:hypothetical protein D3C77_732500 [compost metagenome]
MANDDSRAACGLTYALGDEQIAHHLQLVLVVEADLLHGHLVALEEIVCTVGHVGS